ncbi:MAG: hypothetical protein BA870_08750 [Desulfuromonadales bacterium C00003094]|jgi:endonuclease/exonuclease/phosphatase (EEP) superfamily protein YafD|nr:MAG: hypothetical protein BA870_08750 [Desulfuromonadales bacterium C00003094]OEU75178.1 MAG: hypothetical protein BA869_07205 [Desulfuromonadales bacterium C00003107]
MPNLVWMAWLFFGVIILAGLILRWWTGDHLILTRYTGYLMPWLLCGLLPGVLWAVLMKYRGLAALLTVSVLIILVAYAPLFWSRSKTSDPEAMELKVVSYNTWSKNFDTDRIARVVKGQRPDVLLLQEVIPEVFESLMKHFHDLYADQEVYFSYEPSLLLAVVSRFPMERSAGIKGKGRVQRVFLHSPAGQITVFNVHMLRRGGWLSRYRKIVSLLEEDVSHNKGPVILGGDFNTPDQGETYKHITKFLNNAHWESGFGFGFSFPSSVIKLFGSVSVPPLVRIDHIFFNDCFSILKAGTIKDSGGSDHFPVMAILGLE